MSGDIRTAGARLRRAVVPQDDRRPRHGTLGRMPLEWLGVLPGPEVEYVPRGVDDLLADRVARADALVVVTGPRLAGTSRSAARAAQQQLPTARVVAPGRTSHVDVAALVAARRGAVVWLDGAPLAVLDQITPQLVRDARAARVRIVVTTRPELVGADHPDPLTEGILHSAAVAVAPLTEAEAAGGPYRPGQPVGREVLPGRAAAEFLAGGGWTSMLPRAVAMVAATWELLDVPLPLTPDRLAALVPEALGRLRVPRPDPDEISAAIRHCARGPVAGTPVLVAGRRDGQPDLRAHPLVIGAAMTGRSPLVDGLREALGTDAARLLVARTALARGDEAAAAVLLRNGPAGGLCPRYAVRMAELTGDARLKADWYRSALGADDPRSLREVRARLGTLLVDDGGDEAEARELLAAAVPDQRALIALGQLDGRRRRDDDARARWVAAAAGPDAGLAAIGAWCAATVDLEAGRDDDALPLLEQAFGGRGAPRHGWAGLALARLHRRRGEDDRAEEVLNTILGEPRGWRPEFTLAVRDQAVVELGRLTERRAGR